MSDGVVDETQSEGARQVSSRRSSPTAPWARYQKDSTGMPVASVVTRSFGLSLMLTQGLVACVSQRCLENAETGRQGQTTWEN